MANDDCTLEQIAGQHEDMVKTVIHLKARRKFFPTRREAEAFRGDCVRHVLEKYKVIWEPGVPEGMLDLMMAKAKIKIEDHNWSDIPIMEHGTYIYCDDELIAFVSFSMPFRSASFHHKPHFMVITNVQC